MAGQRNRIIELVDFIEQQGVEVNIAKNKARGNKGFFRVKGDRFRIDISKSLDEKSVLSTLVHEFSHFVHYKYDKTLKSLDFIFDNTNNDLINEMINLTVDSIPKESVAPMFKQKEDVKKEIKELCAKIQKKYPDFKPNNLTYPPLERKLRWMFFDENVKTYLEIKYRQKILNRINSRINRLNRYYNSPTELFARTMEAYVFDKENFKQRAPRLMQNLDLSKVPVLKDFIYIVDNLYYN